MKPAGHNTGLRARLPGWLRRTVELCLLLSTLALLALLSNRHASVMDWTANARNTLTPASRTLLQRMSGPIRVQAFADDTRVLHESIKALVQRYQRYYPQLQLQLVDPALSPRLAREAGATANGTLVIHYAERQELVTSLNERAVSNALNRLARAQQRWIAYLSGAGQRDLLGEAGTDLGLFGQYLRELGFRLRPLDLAADGEIPESVTLLVVLEPSTSRPGAVDAVVRFLEHGGNLLWLSDARHHDSLAQLESLLGVKREIGMLVDPTSALYGQRTPEFVQVSGYAEHPVTAGLKQSSAFPTATSLGWESVHGWRVTGLAASAFNSWLETGDLDAEVRFDDGADSPGPLHLGVAMERTVSGGQVQRAAVFGDADFLSNAYLGLLGNKDLGGALVSWLSGDDSLIDVPALIATDLDFAPSPVARAAIALAAPLLLPLVILAIGVLSWHRRRRQ